jgi:GNAT superfamily N-acetyltransferase
MKLIEVNKRKGARDFIKVAHIIYRNDKNWVCPLDKIINSIFDPRKNSYFEDGEATRWILVDTKGKLIGRVAAFYNASKARKYQPQTGGLGFFECINNQEAAFILFDACAKWLHSKGMGAMDGPVNFGENDNYWGLLVEGFMPPAFGMNYNPPYYKELFEAYGFEPFFEQESRHLDLTKPFPDRFWKIAEWVMRKPGYTFEHIRKKNFEKYAADLANIYNSAWIYHEHFSPLNISKVKKEFEETKFFLIEDFIWFIYHDNKPIAFIIMFPDVNQLLKDFKGKLGVWNRIRFWWLKNSKRINRSRVTIMGVAPEFQGLGLESVLFWHLRKPLFEKRPHYKELEISWVGDFNPKMKATLEAMAANPGKKHITYRKIFGSNAIHKKATKIPDIREKVLG